MIGDTHGFLRPEAVAALRGVDRILHAGDVGSNEVLEGLRAIAPVDAVRGNNDLGSWAQELPVRAELRIGKRRIVVVHALADLGEPGDVVVCGHSHQAKVSNEDGFLLVNPGSAGPRRFALPVTIARLVLGPDGVEAEIVQLEARPAKAL